MANIRDYPPGEWRPIALATNIQPWRFHGKWTSQHKLDWTNARTGKGSVDWRRMHGTRFGCERKIIHRKHRNSGYGIICVDSLM